MLIIWASLRIIVVASPNHSTENEGSDPATSEESGDGENISPKRYAFGRRCPKNLFAEALDQLFDDLILRGPSSFLDRNPLN